MVRSEFVGVDGCPAGWFSVGMRCSSECEMEYELQVFREFKDLLKHHGAAQLVLVDIPIGLPEGPEGRDCDREARKKLGPRRRSSVFPTPTRCTAQKTAESPRDRTPADETERRCAGKGLSSQAFAIAPKIAEVDRVMLSRGTHATPQVREVHPEVCFWALDRNEPMSFSKKDPEGLEERLRVLGKAEPRAGEIFDAACSRFFRKRVTKDDILDALAAAVTAYRGHNHLRTLPVTPDRDGKGLPMEMVYCVNADGEMTR